MTCLIYCENSVPLISLIFRVILIWHGFCNYTYTKCLRVRQFKLWTKDLDRSEKGFTLFKGIPIKKKGGALSVKPGMRHLLNKLVAIIGEYAQRTKVRICNRFLKKRQRVYNANFCKKRVLYF